MNDLGFIGRADYRGVSPLIGFQTFQAGKLFRQSSAFAFSNHVWDFGGQSIFQGFGSGANVTFNNLWGVGFLARANPRYFDPWFTRGGPIAGVPEGWSLDVNGNSDTRRIIWIGGDVSHSVDASGANTSTANIQIDARPTASVHVNFGPSLVVQHTTGQYVTTVADPLALATYGQRYVFADLHQTTVSLDTRVDWTLSTTLSVQVYAQPFVSAGHFTHLKEFARPGTYDFLIYGRDRGTVSYDPAAAAYTIGPDGPGPAPAFTVANPDFNLRSLRGNAVLRWEYRPGSALFVVWQQQRSDVQLLTNFEARRDLGAIFRQRATNVFLVKATYWLGR